MDVPKKTSIKLCTNSDNNDEINDKSRTHDDNTRKKFEFREEFN